MNKSQMTIAVAGAGRMGEGIAQVFATAGCRVHLLDMKERSKGESQKILKAAVSRIKENLEFLTSLSIFKEGQAENILERIKCFNLSAVPQALQEAEVIFEAVPEVMEVKEKIFSLLTSYVSDKALIASTTSTFQVEELAYHVRNPERFMNTHWLNPAYLIPLVEVSPGNKTSPSCLEKMLALLESAGKVPVKCAPSPGFIVPRIQALAMNEAARMVEEGVASPEDIDRAVRLGFGLRFAVLGLIEFIDWGGADILYYAGNYLKGSLKDAKFAPPPIITEKIKNGETGLKAGRGFYDYRNRDISEYRKETISRFVELLKHLDLLPPSC